ncbi:MAG: HAMP domain-containing histidine kinase [Defluviitaleaceae bacterium]|nr:HAMP domain-containing histidine kinase [Defluviitaleaceae bacterium]
MKKALMLLICISILSFVIFFVLVHTSTPSRMSTTAINEAIMYAIDFIEEADHAGALDALMERMAVELEQMNQITARRNRNMLWAIGIYKLLLILSFVWLYLHYKRQIIIPLNGLKNSARNIAMGELDIPLKATNHELLQAFSESLDLLRDMLKNSRESERESNRRKKELIASLSHDIRTPVAAIKATIELMQIREYDDKTNYQLQEMQNKTEQINTLINDMFHSALEELQVLTINTLEFPSTVLTTLIRNADYKKMVDEVLIPDCILLGDIVRLQQVFDNIIGNAYKYANTKISVSSDFEDDTLAIIFRDFGSGANEDELPLLFDKFYRGKDTLEVSGYGLGLHMAKYLLQGMGGNILISNARPGFVVKIILKLAF